MNFSRADAGSADPHAAGGAFHQRANRLQVYIPAALANVMSVADLAAKLRPAAAYLTNLCHKAELSLVVTKYEYTKPGNFVQRKTVWYLECSST